MPNTLPSTILVSILLLGGLARAGEPSLFAGPYIMGSSVYTARDFATEIAAHVGQPTSADMLESLRRAIRNRYTRDGYVTPIISIPSQDLKSINPRLIIHEARISGIEIRGDAGPYRTQIDELARGLRQSNLLRKEQLRTVLNRISQLPGISSKPLFDPRPDSTNEFLLVLRVQYQAISGRVELNNGGTKGLGRELLAADVATNDLLGLEEQMRFSGAISSHPDRYQYEEARLQRTFSDTTLFVDVSGSKAVPDPDIYFRNVHFSAGLTQQWQLPADRVVLLGASFNGDNGSVRDSATVPWIEDHERNVALGLTLVQGGDVRPGRLFVGAQRGLDVVGSAINEGAYSEVDPGYTKYLLDTEQIIPVGGSWSLQINVNGQITAAILPVLDRFTFGGIGFGAAFDPGTLSGDCGAEVSVQLARVIRFKRWGLQYLRLYVRSDTGVVWNNSPYFYHREEATSAGGGVLARWTHVLSTIELSTPLDQPRYVSAQSVRMFGSVAYVF